MSSYIKREPSRRSDDTMDDDGDDKDDTKRKSRNLSEKKRRDQFNMLINELSSMVSTNNRKMDKSTVLKSTISFLKNHNELAVRSRAHEIQEDWKPSFLSNEEFTHLILEALDGFIMVFSSSGRIFYASESITSLLGHLPSDLMNMTIYDMVYEEDQSALYNILLNPASSVDSMNYGDTKENQVSFSCHMRRGGLDFRDEDTYELVQFVGYFRSDIDPLEVDHLISTSNRLVNFSGEVGMKLVFVGVGRLQTPLLIREMSVVDSTKSEFTSRHSLEWKFLFLDHRAPPIIGYLPFEVLGTSGYDYYHVDDLEKVVTCHEALMQKGEGTSCHYRFLTKGQQWIWLQTRFYITYHQWNSKPEFIVCTHRVVSYLDVMKQMRKDPEEGERSQDSEVGAWESSDKQQVGTTSQGSISSSAWTSRSSAGKVSRAETKSPVTQKQHQSGCTTNTGPSAATTPGSATPSPGSACDSVVGVAPTSSSAQATSSRNSQLGTRRTKSVSSKIQMPVTPPAQPQRQQQQPQQQQQQEQSSSSNAVPTSTSQVSLAVAAPFLEAQQQYVTAIPVQPVLATGFPAVVTTLPATELVRQPIAMTTAQNNLQEQLERKHEELQQLIVQQQEELRRVSEQLFMARYGLLSPMSLNITSTAASHLVTLPYNTAVSSTTSVGRDGESSTPVSSELYHAPLTVATVTARTHTPTASIMIDPQQVNLQAHGTEEAIPFQLSQQQAQLLFSSPNSGQQQQ